MTYLQLALIKAGIRIPRKRKPQWPKLNGRPAYRRVDMATGKGIR